MVQVTIKQNSEDREGDHSAELGKEAAANGSPFLTVVEAEVNLSSNELWKNWHHWLKVLEIAQVLVPTQGAEMMVRPPPVNIGVRRFWMYVVELTGTTVALDALCARFGPEGTLRKMWRPMAERVLQRGTGESSSATAEASLSKQRKARARLGNEAAKNDVYSTEE